MVEMTLAEVAALAMRLSCGDPQMVPQMIDPVSREVRGLSNTPTNIYIPDATRSWAGDLGREHYFIVFPEGNNIRTEEYRQGKLIGSQLIVCN